MALAVAMQSLGQPPPSSRLKGFLIIVGVFCLIALASAETVELKTGERIEGVLKSVTGEEVLLEVAGQPLKFPQENVSAIYLAAPPKGRVVNPLDDALGVLKGLQSAVNAGATYGDFAPRVTDAKVHVDQMLSEAPDSPAKTSLAEALGFYVYASNAWNARINKGLAQWDALQRNPLFEKCEPLKRACPSSNARASALPEPSASSVIGDLLLARARLSNHEEQDG
jgi:hypothetical protein